MSDTTQSNNQQTIVIALVVVAVLLASLIGVLIYQQSQAAKIAQLGGAPVAQTPSTGQPAAGPGTGATAPFDAKTATKLPAGTTPEAFVKAYHVAVVAGKYDVAYKMLPLPSQQKYVSATSYASQIKPYGITGYKLGKLSTSGDTASIVGLLDNPSMPIAYTWNFKKVGSDWYVESRVMGGSVQ